jgi:hypothetical protein
MIRLQLSATTTTGGGATTVADHAMAGVLYAVQLIDGDFADGVDITLTCEQENLSIPLLVKADFNSDQMVYPRVAEALNTNGSALTTYAMPVINGKPQMVIAAGGATKTGGCILYIAEL